MTIRSEGAPVERPACGSVCWRGRFFWSESAPDDETIRPGGAPDGAIFRFGDAGRGSFFGLGSVPDGAFFSAYVRRTGCFLARGASVGETIRPEGSAQKN